VHTGKDINTNPACLNEILPFLRVATKDTSPQLKIARWRILFVILSIITLFWFDLQLNQALWDYEHCCCSPWKPVNSICEGCL